MLLSIENTENLKIKLHRSKAGDMVVREELLGSCKPFIIRVASKICRRVLIWGHDDELSIGLIAMNEAIDRYEENYRVPFFAYARMVIKGRLTDYFRQENRYAKSNLLHRSEETGRESMFEVARAWEQYLIKETSMERKSELEQYESKLEQYKISLENLIKCSPRHSDSRALLLKTAKTLACREELMQYLQKNKRLPVVGLTKLTGINRKTLERGRKYIIAAALIFYHSEEFVYLNWYLRRDMLYKQEPEKTEYRQLSAKKENQAR